MSEVSARGPGHRKEDWITLQFRRVYDDALQDSVPPEMLELLNGLDERGDAAGEDDSVRGEGDKDEGGSA